MEISQSGVIPSQNRDCSSCRSSQIWGELKAGNPEGRIFVETVEMTSITRYLERISCSASGNQLVSAIDRFPLRFLAIMSI